MGKNDLIIAYEKGDRHLFDLLIANGADFNSQHGFRLLLDNCRKQEMSDCEFLLKNGAPTNGHDSNGMCPLMEASQNGFIEKVRILLRHSLKELNNKNKDGLSSLSLACINNQLEVARLLIEHGADFNSTDYQQETAFMKACKHQNRELVELLLSHGANALLKNRKEQTCLSLAYRKKRKDLVKYLISKEANLMNEDKEFLVKVVKCNDLDMVKYLIERNIDLNAQARKDKNTALTIAVQRGYLEIAKLLIEKGANLDLMDDFQNTALMLAAGVESSKSKAILPLVTRLIEMNADLNIQNSQGETALTIAVLKKNPEIAEKLIEHGANLDLSDKDGNSALMIALRMKNFPMAQKLIEYEINLNLVDKDGNSALMIAAEKQEFIDNQVIQMMIRNNVDLDLINKRNESALIIALKSENADLAKVLVENGAHLDLADKTEKTALHYACSSAMIELVHLLIEKGAQLNLQDKEGKTPLMISLERKYFMISQMLIENDAKLDLVDKEEENVWFYWCNFKLSELKNYKSRFIHGICYQFNILKEKFTEKDLLWLYGDYKQDRVMFDVLEELSSLELRKQAEKDEAIRKLRYAKLEKCENKFVEHLVESHKRCLDKMAEKSHSFDHVNVKGQTPLLRAIQSKSDKWIAEYLISRGANISHRDKEGKTALHYAMAQRDFQLFQLLINHGANVNENEKSEPYLYLACDFCRFDSKFCEMLIEKGANLHCKYEEKRLFSFLCECQREDTDYEIVADERKTFIIYRNALIKELSDTFKYTEYAEFKRRVIESIDNEQIILVDADHLEALRQISKNEKELEEEIGHLKSLEFREKLIVDYINVLDDQEQHLLKRKLELNEIISELSELSCQDNKENCKMESFQLRLKKILPTEWFEHFLYLVNMPDSDEIQFELVFHLFQDISKRVRLIKSKKLVARELLELVEDLAK